MTTLYLIAFRADMKSYLVRRGTPQNSYRRKTTGAAGREVLLRSEYMLAQCDVEA